MPHYRIEGTQRSSGRKNTRAVYALGVDHAKELAEEKGISVEFCERQDDAPPTDRQIAYAQSLGIHVGDIRSIREMSSAISIETGEDRLAHPMHVALAEGMGIDTWSKIGKRELFNVIFQWFSRPGQEQQLCAWFAFRVYRHQCGNRAEAGEHTFPSTRFDRIGAELAAEPSMIGSIQRAGRDAGPFIWFGSWKAPDGARHQGNSKSSKAFKRTIDLLGEIATSRAVSAPRGSFQHVESAVRVLSRSSESEVAIARCSPVPGVVLRGSRTCERCGHTTPDASDNPTAACQRCGAIYAKVNIAQERQRAAIQAVKARIAQARERKALRPALAEMVAYWWRQVLGLFRRG